MAKNFYDKVAKKFGNYQSKINILNEFPQGNPEAIFKQKLLAISSKNKTALDSGCADGVFTLSIASYFKKIVAIDNSKGMLQAARKYQQTSQITNVNFVQQNIHKISFPANSFDIIYNRRGPEDFPLFYKILKSGGYYLAIDIGEKDTQAIKEVFNRGQNFGKWHKSFLEAKKTQLSKVGFKIIYCGNFLYNEYYLSRTDLDLFLQGVPIFEDYDSHKDKKLLDEYVRKFNLEQGINLPRHRIVILAQKL
ncbi:MAG: class I SAM-dependent methyltransferase [Candidatus Beckwithbacteria bacterium]|nr:class I SAM-dependent methyltransferase [Candidatus Beckwithbacteria bacterium]